MVRDPQIFFEPNDMVAHGFRINWIHSEVASAFRFRLLIALAVP
jgi:hypothetical protein